MRLSRYLLPTLKETPSEATIASHQLMLRAGLVRQSASGIYSWLPLGFRVLTKIEAIVREEQNRAGALEVLMPTIQSADLWRESGRYDDYGAEMLRIKDRGERELLYGPTNEELITDIFRGTVRSYKDLPLNLYHIQWKFRDEVRPRFGVMRGREFLMKDAYSFDLDAAGAKRAYNRMFVAYLRTFARMGLKAIPMAADTGPIGGNLSHEFIILAETGESQVYCHRALIDMAAPGDDVDYDGDLAPLIARRTAFYAATEEKHDAAAFEAIAPEDRVSARGIEVGHIFYFGTKYSKPMGALVTTQTGESIPVEMGSYGIGVSRLAGAIIEASHDEAGIIWPDAVAPFRVGLVNLRAGDKASDGACEDLYARLTAAGVDVLYDDTDERAGAKFSTMDLIGLPWQLIVGPRGLANGVVELKRRATGAREELSIDSALQRIAAGRYLKPSRKEGLVSVIAIFSFLGIMLGVATLIIVMAVMNGFRIELLDRILGLNGHIVVQSVTGPFEDFDPMTQKLRQVPGVVSVTPFVEGQVMVSAGDLSSGGIVRGVRREDLLKLPTVASHLKSGSLDEFTDGNGIIIGQRLADQMGVRVGASITLMSARGPVTPFGIAPQVKAYRVLATFEIGMSEYDAAFIFMPLEEAQLYFNKEKTVSGLEVMVADPDAIGVYRGAIAKAAEKPVQIVDWQQMNDSFFSALQVERNVMFLILTLIILVAALNIVSGLIMLVKDKAQAVAILRTMGASQGAIMRVFFMTGAAIGASGTLAGFLLGVVFCRNIENIRKFLSGITGTKLFDPTIYFLEQMPAKMDPGEVAAVVLMALTLSFLATLYPSWRAARLDPVDALRYE